MPSPEWLRCGAAACRETGRECAGRPCVPGRAGPAACPGPCCAGPPPRPGRQAAGRPGAHRPGLVGARPGHRPARLVRRHVPAGGAPAVGRGARRRRLPRDDPPRRPAGRGRAAAAGLQHRPPGRLPGGAPGRRGAPPAGVDRRRARPAGCRRQGRRRHDRRDRARGAAGVARRRPGQPRRGARAHPHRHLGVRRARRAAHLVGADVRADGPGPVVRAATGGRVPRQRAPGRHGADPRGGRGAGHLRGRPGDRLPGAAPRRLRAPRPDPDRRTPVG